MVEQAGRVGSDFWLSHWADEIELHKHSSHFYLGIYCGMALACSVLVFVRGYGVGYAGITSATRMHNGILGRGNTRIFFILFSRNPIFCGTTNSYEHLFSNKLIPKIKCDLQISKRTVLDAMIMTLCSGQSSYCIF